jgi:hypothetical protein
MIVINDCVGSVPAGRDFFNIATYYAGPTAEYGQERSLKFLLLYIFEISYLNQQEHAIP